MRLSVAEEMEIIKIVEQSQISVIATLKHIGPIEELHSMLGMIGM